MTPERWRRIEDLFDAALPLPGDERSLFLNQQCGADDELRRELEEMLRSDSAGNTVGQVLQQAVTAVAKLVESREGHRLGPYRILRTIGAGGMGAVFLAVRDDDEYHKEVAIKTLKFEASDSFALARFRQERQVLAGLEHPNIARLLDGGTSERGMPYLVMEYVAGIPITDYCREQALSLEARGRLFQSVCEAVHYAHQRLVVHRDLKPPNILVTAEGVPKLVDFGIAKLLDPPDGSSLATRTVTGLLLMTPEYASPEQARGEPISIATDVYSLGAVLYEILTGERAHVLDAGSAADIARVICDAPVRPPSLIGGRRLRGDLDNIVLKAMNKDTARRYTSAGQFAEDLHRYLEGLPVLAQPDSVPYRMRKYIRRHWVGVSALAAVLLSLAGGAAVAVQQARQARRQFNQVRQLAHRFLFDFHDELATVPGTVKAREMMVSTALEYLNQLAAEATHDPGLQWELAAAYGKVAAAQGGPGPSLGRYRDAVASLEKAQSLARPLADRSQLDTPQMETYIGFLIDEVVLHRSLREYQEAARIGREAVRMSATISPSARAKALSELALTLNLLGDLMGGVSALQQVLPVAREEAQREPSPANRLQLADVLLRLGIAESRLTRFAQAAAEYDEALAVYRALAAEQPNNPRFPRLAGRALTNRGDVAGVCDRPSLENYTEAAAWYEQAIAAVQTLIAADPNDRNSRLEAGLVHDKIACSLSEADPQRALRHAKLSAELLDVASRDRADRAQPRIDAANAYRELKQYAAAEAELEEAVRICSDLANEGAADLSLAWARLETARGRPGAAAQWYGRVIKETEALYRSKGTPPYALGLVRALAFASDAIPESAREYRQRIFDVWSEQDQRFPGQAYIGQQLAKAKAGLLPK